MQIEAKKSIQLIGHQASIYSIIQKSNAMEILSCGSDKTVRLWNLKNKEQTIIAQFPTAVYSICFDGEREILLAGLADGQISILDLGKKQEVKILKQHSAPVFEILLSKKQNTYIAAAADGTISFINASSLACEKIVRLCNEKIRSLDLTADETEMAVACGDGSIRLFDLLKRTEKFKLVAHADSTNSVRYHPDGAYLLSGGKDAQLCIWKRNATCEWELYLKIPAHNFAIYSIVFHPNGTLFATGSRDKTVKIWDSKSFDFLLRVNKENQEGHTHSVNKVLWTNFDEQLLSAGDDRLIMAWKVA